MAQTLFDAGARRGATEQAPAAYDAAAVLIRLVIWRLEIAGVGHPPPIDCTVRPKNRDPSKSRIFWRVLVMFLAGAD